MNGSASCSTRPHPQALAASDLQTPLAKATLEIKAVKFAPPRPLDSAIPYTPLQPQNALSSKAMSSCKIFRLAKVEPKARMEKDTRSASQPPLLVVEAEQLLTFFGW